MSLVAYRIWLSFCFIILPLPNSIVINSPLPDGETGKCRFWRLTNGTSFECLVQFKISEMR